MDRETLAAFREAARRFAAGEVRAMVGTEGRDGELGRLPATLEAAAAAGLVASPDPGHPGHEWGVWGRASREDGPAASLAVLEELARECAGFAASVHAAGVGTLALDEAGRASPAAALVPADARLPWEDGVPPGDWRAWSSVLAAPGSDTWVLSAGDGRWLAVPAGAAALEVEEVAPRTGLAAVRVVRLALAGGAGQVRELPRRDPAPVLVAHLLGLAAIAVGNARGALEAAARYARERYQGGAEIGRHPAVRLLLGEVAARVAAAAGHVHAAAAAAARSELGPLEAAGVKLAVCGLCRDAVSDALQVLGGYGYMEDYRLEKRLRDALTLVGLRPAGDEVRLALGSAVVEGRP